MYGDYLRQHARLQQASHSLSGSAMVTSWTTVLSFPCRLTSVDSKSNDIYRREGFTNVVRLAFDDRIRRTDGSTSMADLLKKTGETRHRFVFEGRNLVPVAIKRPSEGCHDYMPQIIMVDCSETLENVGYWDKAS